MYRLRLFGGVSLVGPSGAVSGTAVQQRPLALLALLAVSHHKGCSRDKLIDYLWPDSDREHGRHRLADIVYLIRKPLGEDAVVASGEMLFLNPAVVETDVGAFVDCLEARDFEAAVARYDGSLLDGFWLNGAPEFERWMEAERQRLGDEYCGALQALAAASRANRDDVEAVKWWRRLLTYDPYNSRFALGLIEALAQSGDPANARLVAKDHAQRLRHELEIDPPSDFSELVDQLIENRTTMRLPESTAGKVLHLPEQVAPGASIEPGQQPPKRRVRSLLKASALVALAVLLIVGGRLLLTRPAPHRMSVAVLPFEHRSSDPDDAFLAEGIHDEIIGQLGRIAALRVISRTSVMAYKGRTEKVQAIAADLHVTHVMEGSFSRAGDRVRIAVQLIDAVRDAPVWGENYERRLSDIFAIQSDVAQQVAAALRARLSPREAGLIEREPTTSLEAYDFYLRGNSYMNRGFDEEFVRIAIRMYENAVGLDPRFGIAWARLSKAHVWMYWLYYDHTERRLAESTRAIDQALLLDPDHPEIRVARAWYFYHGHMDYEQALQELEIVQTMQPNHSEALALVHYIQRRQGRFEAAAANVARALELDPRNGLLHDQASQTYRLMRDYPAAQHHVERAILLEPSSATGYLDAIRLHLKWTGSTAAARNFLQQARRAGVADNEFLRHAAMLVELFAGEPWAALDRLRSEAAQGYSIYPYFVPKHQLAAQAHGLLRNFPAERALYDSARMIAEVRIRDAPNDDRLYSALGIALAGLGRRDEAIAAGKKAVELMPIEMDAWRGAARLEDLARIYTMVGEHETALDHLEYLLSVPSPLSVALLSLDPAWAPLVDHPRFKALLEKHSDRSLALGGGAAARSRRRQANVTRSRHLGSCSSRVRSPNRCHREPTASYGT